MHADEIPVREIREGDILYAMVFKDDSPSWEGVRFFTRETNPFQLGYHHQKAGVKLAPHVHRLDHPLYVNEIQEMLFVRSGKIRVTIYTKEAKPVDTVELSGGEAILLLTGGHGVEFLEETRIFEIKQGPYPGTANAKIFLTPEPHV